MVWSMDDVIEAAKNARGLEDVYETALTEYPFEDRKKGQQVYIDVALSRFLQAKRDWRRIVLNDPEWHPDRTYPSPMDYRKVPE